MSSQKPMSRDPVAHQLGGPALVAILIFWLILFALGYPLSTSDDLYFIGPALHMLAGGDSSNPYCPVTHLLGATDQFFVYMPLHAHVLAVWLYFFGVNRVSLAVFQTMGAVLASLALTILISPSRPGWKISLAVCFVVAGFLGSLGLRPESLGLAFFTWGLVGVNAGSRWAWVLGCASFFLAVITCPTFVLATPILLGGAFYFRRLEGYSWSEIMKRGILAGLALGGVLSIFLVLIGFQLFRFLTVFHTASSLASHYALLGNIEESTVDARFALRALMMGGEPLLPLTVAFAAAWWSNLFVRPIPRALVIFGGILGFSSYLPAMTSWGAMRLTGFVAIVLALFVVVRLRQSVIRLGFVAWLMAAFLFFLISGVGVIQMCGRFLCPPGVPTSALQAEIARLKPTHVYVDSFALFVVYDYRLPPQTYDYNWSLINGGNIWPQPAAFPPGSVLVISPQTLCRAGALPLGSYRPIPFPGFSRFYPSNAGNPYDCVVMTSEPTVK